MAGRRADEWDELCAFLDTSPSSFGGQLLTLIGKADPVNRARLRQSFPRQVAAWETWRVIAPCAWGELQAAIPAYRVTVTYDLSDSDADFALVQALEDFAIRQRDMAGHEGGSESRTRWADAADRMRAQAEAAGS